MTTSQTNVINARALCAMCRRAGFEIRDSRTGWLLDSDSPTFRLVSWLGKYPSLISDDSLNLTMNLPWTYLQQQYESADPRGLIRASEANSTTFIREMIGEFDDPVQFDSQIRFAIKNK